MVQETNYACVLLKAMTVEIQDLPVSEVGPEEVKVKVESTGLCGSDVRCSILTPCYLLAELDTLRSCTTTATEVSENR